MQELSSKLFEISLKIYRFIFQQYYCPSCGGKLYRLHQTPDLDVILARVGSELILVFIAIPIVVGFVGALFGGTLGFIVLILICTILYFRYPPDRSNEYYACELCDKEFNYPEINKSESK